MAASRKDERLMKQVYMAQDPIEAHLVVDLLQAQGIAATVQGEHLFAIRGVVPISYPTVWVLDDDYERARQVALDYDQGQYDLPGRKGPPAAPWTCPNCGEQIEGQFDQCWNCNTERPTESPI
jgi:hypothetical protein